jgi:GR25 family glycosyltransferase involved in LPS biosynthesis
MSDFFDKIYCINLDRRPDRWEKVSKQFNELSLKVERFPAYNGNSLSPHKHYQINNGEVGCFMSHYRILEKIISSTEGTNFLILEDDVEFCKNFNSLLEDHLKQLPEDWDMVYLSGHIMDDFVKVGDNLYKGKSIMATDSYFVNKKSAEKIKKILDDNFLKRPVDYVYMENQKNGNLNAYFFKPFLTRQTPDFSDIQNVHRDYLCYYDNTNF